MSVVSCNVKVNVRTVVGAMRVGAVARTWEVGKIDMVSSDDASMGNSISICFVGMCAQSDVSPVHNLMSYFMVHAIRLKYHF